MNCHGKLEIFIVHDVQEQPAKNAVDGAYIARILSAECGF
jgi:hypothetical protein